MAEVSVIVAVYNGMPYLPEAVESILTQTLRDLIVLIVDDGSTDGTADYLSGLTDPRIQVVHQPNRGRSAARSRALAMCDTEFVAVMDADDVSLPGRLEAEWRFLQEHHDVGLVGTQVAYFATAGRAGFSPHVPCEHDAICDALVRGRHGLVNATIMCRTSVLRHVAGMAVDGIGEDWDRMFLRMGEVTRLSNLAEVLYHYRLHPLSACGKQLPSVRLHYAYACDCARRRAEGAEEISYSQFLHERRARPLLRRIEDVMDGYALAQYRHAVTEILSSRPVRGYARLIWSSICGPQRSFARLAKIMHGGGASSTRRADGQSV